MYLNVIVVFVALLVNATFGANILFFFALSTYSHRIAVWPLVEELVKNGHQITFAQPYKARPGADKLANVTEFYPEKLLDADTADLNVDFLNLRLEHGPGFASEMAKYLPIHSLKVCQNFLKEQETKEWVKKSKFDLVVIDGLMNECGFGLAYKFKAKTILFGTTHTFPWTYETFGFVPETSWIPEIHNSYQLPMTLWQRLRSTLWPLQMHQGKRWFLYPDLDKLFKEHLEDENIPPVEELEKKASLVLQNSHWSEEHPKSLPPLVVSVAGMYCRDGNQKLPKELEDFIGSSGNDGFIYVSFGSAANIAKAPKEFQKIFHDVMKESKMKFVWKYEGERPKELSDNVYTASWLPQQAILAHPKIKAFVTHGGLLGMHEAVWNGVPLIVMPVFAEQDYNAARVQRTQRGLMIDVNSLTKDKFSDAIEKVVKDPKHKLNMQVAQRLFRDRPEHPTKTALWWTEFVLRNDEASLAALKPLGMHQTWYERRLLDVWGVIFGGIGAMIWAVFFILSKIFSFLCGSKKASNATKSRANAKKNQ